MEELSIDGAATLRDGATLRDALLALQKPQVAGVALHKPGSVVKLADGSEYRIGPMGNWIRLSPKRSKKARRRGK